MSKDIKAYHVFIASPSGLIEERKSFRDVLDEYNKADAIERDVEFIPKGWELTLGGVSRPQSLINEELRKCDYLLLMLWDRWGSKPNADGKSRYTSGTEEEYYVGWECLNDDSMPMRDIVVFFKSVDERRLNDPGDDLKKVLSFKEELENKKELLFHTFDTILEFERLIRRYLARWIRDHESGSAVKKIHRQMIPTVKEGQQELTEELLSSESTLVLSESKGKVANLIEEANELAKKGQFVEAETRFARAVVEENSFHSLIAYGNFLYGVGRLSPAEMMYDRILRLAQATGNRIWIARSSGNLGLIYRIQGEYGKAYDAWVKALDIYKYLDVPNMVDRIQGWLDGLVVGSQDAALTEVSELRALIQREFLKLFKTIQQLTESHCPNVFAVLPKDEWGWLKNIYGQKMILQLYCQAPGKWHPTVKGGQYEIKQPSEFLKSMGPYILKLAKVIKYAVPLIGDVAGMDSIVLQEDFKNQLKLMEELAQKLTYRDYFSTELLDRTGVRGKAERIEGMELRALRELLDKEDPAHEWGGLKKVLTPEGHYLWLCEDHAAEYKK